MPRAVLPADDRRDRHDRRHHRRRRNARRRRDAGGAEAGVEEARRPERAGLSQVRHRRPPSSSRRALGGIEVACLDAIGKATGLRLCELFGGPVREEPEFAAYLFYRYAADHPALLADKRIVDDRGKGDKALDHTAKSARPRRWPSSRSSSTRSTASASASSKPACSRPTSSWKRSSRSTRRLGKDHLLRIDPNAVWNVETA